MPLAALACRLSYQCFCRFSCRFIAHTHIQQPGYSGGDPVRQVNLTAKQPKPGPHAGKKIKKDKRGSGRKEPKKCDLYVLMRDVLVSAQNEKLDKVVQYTCICVQVYK